MPIKKSDAINQYGLEQLGNTCYMNTAIQTLLSFPNLQEVIIERRKQLLEPTWTTQEKKQEKDEILSLCTLLDYLLKKQYGQKVNPSELNDAWREFLKHIRSKIVDAAPLDLQQEDSSFALNMFTELLGMHAPLFQQIIKQYGPVNFNNTDFAALEQKSILPCFVLPWRSGIEITKLFDDKSYKMNDAKHPSAYEAGMRSKSPCTEITHIHMQPEADAFVLLPNQIPVEGSPFSPSSCSYNIPGEVKLNIQGIEDTFVLASFGQKIGSTSGGHYIAYRREGINWYEINDGRVTPKGKQGLNEPIMPQEIKSALKSTAIYCPRQLIYVRKSVFVNQYDFSKTPTQSADKTTTAKPSTTSSMKPKTAEPSYKFTQTKDSKLKQAEDSKLRELKSRIFKARVNYCEYSNNIWFSFFHRHGSSGRVRAVKFQDEFDEITSISEAEKSILDFLGNKKNGNTHPHSFRTMLLHELLGSNLSLKDISKTYESKLDELCEQLQPKNPSNVFTL